jgi:hypothetical protein
LGRASLRWRGGDSTRIRILILRRKRRERRER